MADAEAQPYAHGRSVFGFLEESCNMNPLYPVIFKMVKFPILAQF